MNETKERKSKTMKIAALLLALLLAAFAAGCGGETGKQTTSATAQPSGAALYDTQTLIGLAEKLTDGGRAVKYYGPGSEMLEALDDEMDLYIDFPPEEPLQGYLFANDGGNGALDCEVFFFASEGDAKIFYDFFEGGEQFVEGESALRKKGNVVYMGYLDALDEIETYL